MTNKNLTKLIYAGILAALAIVLTRMVSPLIVFAWSPTLRMDLGHISIMLSGILLGPVYGAATGIVADLVGATMFPSPGKFYLGFTLTYALIGMISGLMSHFFIKRKSYKVWLFGVTALFVEITAFTLNTIWLYDMYGKGIFASIIWRVIIAVVLIPILTITVTTLVRLYNKISSNSLK